MREVWEYREEFTRNSLRALVGFKEDQREERQKRAARREEGGDVGVDASKTAFAASATAVLVGALVLRLGGRAALVSVLGLDVVADLGIGDQIDQVLGYAEQAGGWTVVAFIGAWVIAKVFLVDIISIALAFSSGILFGGVVEGALVSAVGATLGSLTAFGLSRTLLQEKVEEKISEQPVARGLTKVVEEDGFKTVFVLRLSPILPIPTGAYPYIYGTSKLNPLTFACGYFLGSLKPYLLDSYLGVFSKQVIDGTGLDESKDLILLVGLGALVLVGAFATELANDSWDLVQEEVRKDKERRAALEEAGSDDGAEGAEGAEEGSGWDGMLGPLNTTAIGASVLDAIPSGVRDESSEVWATLNSFVDEQWAPSLRDAVGERRAEKARQEAAKKLLDDVKNGVQVPREIFRAVTAKPLQQPERRPSLSDFDRRRQMAAWTVSGPWWRETLTVLYFSGALAGSARRRWTEYPETDEELDAMIAAGDDEDGAAAGGGGGGGAKKASAATAPRVILVDVAPTATKAPDSAGGGGVADDDGALLRPAAEEATRAAESTSAASTNAAAAAPSARWQAEAARIREELALVRRRQAELNQLILSQGGETASQGGETAGEPSLPVVEAVEHHEPGEALCESTSP